MQMTDNGRVASWWGCLLCGVMLAAAAFPPFMAGQEARAAAASPVAFLPQPTGPDDPAFTLYREGYSAVLAEAWEQARRAFAELEQRFPESPFADDAAYWTAFSWKSSDREKAATLYRKLLRTYPASPYVSDAVSDLKLMEVELRVARVRIRVPHPPDGDRLVIVSEELQRLRREFDRQREISNKTMQQHVMTFYDGDTLFVRVPVPPLHITPELVPPVDPQVRVRIEALQMLAERAGSAQMYRTLREVALDKQQPALLRQAAIMKLGKFTREDNGAVLLDVAADDADRDIQSTAIEVYARSVPDKPRAVERLVTLFRRFDAAGESRDAPLGTTLYAIASVGDTHATDFLVQLARSHPREEIRSSAVFYLGAIGSDRARAALIRLLKGE